MATTLLAALDYVCHHWPFFLDTVLRVTVLMLVALAAVSLLRSASAAMRHLIYAMTISGVLVMPFFSALLPGWSVLPTWTPLSDRALAINGDSQSNDSEVVPSEGTSSDSEPATISDPQPEAQVTSEVQAEIASPDHAEAAPQSSSRPSPKVSTEPIATANNGASGLRNLLRTMTILWLAGVLVLFGRLSIAHWKLYRVCRCTSVVTDPTILEEFARAAAELGVSGPVRLFLGPEDAMPMTWGLFTSNVLLPSAAMSWPIWRLRLVLLHELAHVKRWDTVTQCLAQAACAVYWFNPLIWIVGGRMRFESEQASDDLVLATDARPSDYAATLVAIGVGYDTIMRANIAIEMARPSLLTRRLQAILEEGRDRRTLTRRALRSLLIVFAACFIPIAMLRAAVEPTEPQQPILAEKRNVESEPARSDTKDTKPDDSHISIGGSVVDKDGSAIAGAKVYLRATSGGWTRLTADKSWLPTGKDDLAETTTDEKGAFTFEDIPAPRPIPLSPDPLGRKMFRWMAIAKKPGHAVAWQYLEDNSPARLQTTPPRSLMGTILDQNNLPITKANVQVLRITALSELGPIMNPSVPGSLPPVVTVERVNLVGSQLTLDATTNEQGQFAIDGLPAEHAVVLLATHPEFHAAPIYAAVTDRKAGAAKRDNESPVPEGAVVGRLERSHRLRLRVVDALNNVPIAGARLTTTGIDGWADRPSGEVTDASGRHTYDHLPRAFPLLVFPPDGSDYLPIFEQLTLSANQYDEERTVEMRRGAIVIGKVTDSVTGSGLEGVKVRSSTSSYSEVTTEHDGRFRIAVLPEKGRVFVAAAPPGYQIQYRNEPIISSRDVDPQLDRPTTRVQLQLDPTARVQGLVKGLDGQPVVGAEVVAIFQPAENRAQRTLNTRTADDGQFTITGLFDGADELSPNDATILVTQREEKLGAVTTVRPPTSEQREVSIKMQLKPFGSFRLRVVDTDKKEPLRDKSARVLCDGPIVRADGTGSVNISDLRDLRTDANGDLVLDSLFAGAQYKIHVGISDYFGSYQSATFRADSNDTFDGGVFRVAAKSSTPLVAPAQLPSVEGLSPDDAFKALDTQFRKQLSGYEKVWNSAVGPERERQLSARTNPVQVFAPAFLSLAEKNPGSDAALKSWIWIFKARLRGFGTAEILRPMKERAHHVLLTDFADRKEIGDCVANFGLSECEQLFEKSPHREVRGKAAYQAAWTLRVHPHGYGGQHRTDPTPEEVDKAIGYLRQVIDNYPDVKNSEYRSLGLIAKKDLDILQNRSGSGMQAPGPPRIGTQAPELVGPDLNGDEMSLAEHRGKVVILFFYGSYGVGGLDRMKSSTEKLVDKNVVMLGVTDAETREKAAEMARTAGVPWRAWYDQIRVRPICDAWGVHSWPSAILIDGNGTIRYKHLHFPSDELNQAVRQLVKEMELEK